ncbi:hypothetical protein TNCV_3654481 [Trichonephila clavipes]|nr:hypothetical protein TNCV_3654481 [Trichonephila clavipes]
MVSFRSPRFIKVNVRYLLFLFVFQLDSRFDEESRSGERLVVRRVCHAPVKIANQSATRQEQSTRPYLERKKTKFSLLFVCFKWAVFFRYSMSPRVRAISLVAPSSGGSLYQKF